MLQPGESFNVSRVQLGSNGVRYLQLADGRGWLFDMKPGANVMCVPHEADSGAASSATDAQMEDLQEQTEGDDYDYHYDYEKEGDEANEHEGVSEVSGTHVLRCGAAIRLHGLQKAPELNGSRGTCVRWLPGTQRWEVSLQCGRELALKPENIAAVEEEEDEYSIGGREKRRRETRIDEEAEGGIGEVWTDTEREDWEEASEALDAHGMGGASV